MPLVFLVEKAILIIVYGLTIKKMMDFKHNDTSVKFDFDFLSRLEIAAGIGLALVSLVSVIDPRTYAFTAGLCALSIILAFIQSRRIILAGDHNVLIKGKSYPLEQLKGLRTGMFTLKVAMKSMDKELSIYVPLTSNSVLREKVEARIRKK